MAENEIAIIVRAVDEATATLKRIENKVEDSNKIIKKSTESVGDSFKSTTNTLLALGNAAASVDRIWTSYQNMQLRLENANERVANSTDRVIDAQVNILRMQRDGKEGTDEYIDAQRDLERAQRSLTISQNNLERANNAVIGTYINIGLQSMTLIASLPTLITSFGGLATSLKSVAITGQIAGTSLKGVATAIAPIAGVLTLLVGAAKLGADYTDSLLRSGKMTEEQYRLAINGGGRLTEVQLDEAVAKAKGIQVTNLQTETQGINNDIMFQAQQILEQTTNSMDKYTNSIDRTTNSLKKQSEAQLEVSRAQMRGQGGIAVSDYRYETREGSIGTRKVTIRQPIPVRDALIRPGKNPIEFDPNDTIIATKNGMGGGTTLVIKGNNIYGTDPDDIADAILLKLRRKINI